MVKMYLFGKSDADNICGSCHLTQRPYPTRKKTLREGLLQSHCSQAAVLGQDQGPPSVGVSSALPCWDKGTNHYTSASVVLMALSVPARLTGKWDGKKQTVFAARSMKNISEEED